MKLFLIPNISTNELIGINMYIAITNEVKIISIVNIGTTALLLSSNSLSLETLPVTVTYDFLSVKYLNKFNMVNLVILLSQYFPELQNTI